MTLSRHTVPRLLLNRELVGPFQSSKRRLTDVTAGGDIVNNVKVLVEEAGWWKELEEIQRLVSKETGLCAGIKYHTERMFPLYHSSMIIETINIKYHGHEQMVYF